MNCSSSYTTDEEMEYLEDRDVTTIIVGYVDAITAPAKAPGKNDLLFKFVVSNGNRRIPILVWDVDLINKLSKEICSSRVVSINGGHCRAVAPSKIKDESNLVPFEVIIKENTEVSFLGYHNLQNQTTNQLQKATFDNIHTLEGLIEISGYIRTKFSLLHNRSGHMTYGLGAITDGIKKITVQVKQFTECEVEIGDYVTVTGILKGQDSLVTIFCDSINNIKLDAEKPALTAAEVQRGSRPVKRIRTSDKKC
ncbi:uncharacterized protein LOC116418299 [Nasonia vitripennis]|uniref:Uncharacterized protein n=2 Tax=Nasonia vitripennis TaxID=7425 RepID=A0A7M7H5E3_NASVI|nr:uncharacterized protein LOC100115762 [Nasonia vitripennis]XP_031778619.1 uncharacterized protein LOC116416097 [Nasonia vitripennis]XP_031779672.1 uncharacterized protein LOC116416199 [Nasonia vitripennis]XP_031789221.1 uncharacterized protein LOC116418299 [Nasonia vitripennis]